MLSDLTLQNVNWRNYLKGEVEVYLTDGSYRRAKILSIEANKKVLRMRLGPGAVKPTGVGFVAWQRDADNGREEEIRFEDVLFDAKTRHVRLWSTGDCISYRFFEAHDAENLFEL